ncbi:MAG: glycosyltransferase [Bacteroidota bacterium]|nr:glycosyltransferase [Bacteroidota bacterium]
MTLLFYIFLIVLAGYFLFLLYFAIGFIKTETYFSIENNADQPLTIIICARNEEKTIVGCLTSIIKQDYDIAKINLILINDSSTDNTVKHAEYILKKSKINYKIISNVQQKGKKQSITYAMQFVNTKLVVMRDADTYTTSTIWLKTISDFYSETQSDFIIAPILLRDNNGLLWALQAIESNILALLASGSAHYKKAFLCNGANLIFTKQLFERANGYESHINIVSGDDVLFLEDVKKLENVKINYLKSESAIVYTYPAFSFLKLIQQKVRWASKFKSNKNKINFSLAILSFLVNSFWLFSLVYSFLVPQNSQLGLIFMLFKLIIDTLLLFLASRFLKNKALLWYAIPVGFIYPLYASIVAIASLFTKPKWK